MSALLGLSALVWLAAAPSSATPKGSIRWTAPATVCPDASEIQDRLRRLLGDDAAPIQAHARVHALSPGWRVELELAWGDRTDSRTLVADHCETLADATVLLVAVTADPVAMVRHGPLEPAQPLEPLSEDPPVVPATPQQLPLVTRSPSAPSSTPARPLPGEPTPPTPDHSHDRGPAVIALGMVDYGSLPRLAAGMAAALAWRWPRARLAVGGRYLPTRRVPSDEPHARQGRVQLGTAYVEGCGRVWLGRVELPLCGGIELGGTRADRFGLTGDRGASDPWLALGASTGLVIPLMPNTALYTRLEGTIPLVYSEYVFGEDVLYRARPVTVRGGLGLEFRWGPQNGDRPENP